MELPQQKLPGRGREVRGFVWLMHTASPVQLPTPRVMHERCTLDLIMLRSALVYFSTEDGTGHLATA